MTESSRESSTGLAATYERAVWEKGTQGLGFRDAR